MKHIAAMGAFALATLVASATEPAAPKPLPDPEGVSEQLVTEDRRSAFLRRMADKASALGMKTALCALDAAGDSRTPVVVRQSDITRGSGIKCYEGDEFSFEDALTAMILPSSNTLAETMSRHSCKFGDQGRAKVS